MPVDYAVLPGRETVSYTRQELDAEVTLAPAAGKLMMFSRPFAPVLELAVAAGLVDVGVWLRGHLHASHNGLNAAGPVLLVWVIAHLRARMLQAPGKEEPDWARAAAVHEQSLEGRVPAPLFSQVKALIRRMTDGGGWHSAYLYVARCTSSEPVHYGACCAGATYPRDGRLLVILGEHLAYGPPEIALATLAHERRHVTWWRLLAYALASTTATLGLVDVGWAAPSWRVAIPVAAVVRVVATLALWAVEVSCDVGAARDFGKGAIVEAVRYKQRTKGGSRALWPAPQRVAVGILTWVAGPEHPPYALRCWLIRRLAR